MEDELEPSLRPRTQIQGRILLLTICAAGIGGTFQFGYNLSIINAPTSHIQEFTNETWQARTGEPLPDHLVLLMWSLIVSLYPLGGLFGALLAGPLAITLGRKKSLLVNNIFVVSAAILFGFSRKAGSFEMIMLGRLLVGVNAGVSMNIQPMYLGESAPKELRGAVAMSSGIFTALGIVMGQVVGLRELLGGPQAWPLLLASCLVPGALQLASLPLLPESPRYLLIDCGDTEACLAALRRLRGSGDLAGELEELEEERAACQGCRARRPWELFQHRALRRQVTSLVVLGSAMELCGNDSVYAYASSVFRKAGVPEAKIQYAIIGTGSCELLTAVVSSSFPWTLYLAMACIFAFILSFGIGPAGVTGILATELFDQMARPAACMVCGALMWIMLFLVGLGFPFIMVLGSFLIRRRPCPTSSMSLSLVSVSVGPSTLACSFLRPKARPSKRSPRNYTDSASPGGPRAPRGEAWRLSSQQNSSPKGVARAKASYCPVLCFLPGPWSSLPPAFLI
ncbi:solute carrier family 2, facilitated glucose transporter member 11 isoform X8 [Pan troglodytes]|uniref:solute carrier family 2, facilitated glucose transporter member 11 isoform X8 n=1 Tax=Pan troglodytes TaxID=9598 RepID=UPI0030137D21